MNRRLITMGFLSASIFAGVSCTSDKQQQSRESEATTQTVQDSGDRSISVMFVPSRAGGMIEDTFTVSAKVTSINRSSREITLSGNDGSTTTFTAGPEIRNFDQINVGDTVSATIYERLFVYVRQDGSEPKVVYAAALARAPKGARPGAMVSEAYAMVAKVESIDADERTATLRFSDDERRVVPVREDVDLSRYKPGDNVVIEVTQSLAVLVDNE